MSYEAKMKRSGEDSMIINIDPDGFRVEDSVHIRNPMILSTLLKQLIQAMEREDFEEMEIKKI